MVKEIVGLEVGAGTVKIVKLVHKKNTVRLKALGQMEIPLLHRGGDISQQTGVISGVLRSLLDRYQVRSRQIVSGVGGESVVVRKIKVPYMKESELQRAIQWEAEEYIPYPINQVSLGFDILNVDPPGQENREISLLLVGVKNETIQNHIQILRASGVSCQIVDVDALALFNSYVWSNPQDNKGVALLEIGYRRTDIVLIGENHPFLVRSVDLGGFHLTRALSEELGINYTEAERVKKKYGLLGVKEELVTSEDEKKDEEVKTKVDEIIRKTLEELVGEIIHSFEYYSSHTEGTPIRKLVLSGGTALLKNVDRFLSEELGVPVEMANPFKRVTCDPKRFSSESLTQIGPVYAVTLGLALRKISSYD